MEETRQANSTKLEIFTFGRFLVKRGDKALSEDANRSYKLWELFKYLVTNRGKCILPEVIFENLWPDKDYNDSKRALRTLVYRLRLLLDKDSTSNNNCIMFSHGGYIWRPDSEAWLDLDEIEDLYKKAQEVRDSNPTEAMKVYKEAITLYKGDFLPESSYSEWVIPTRNHFQHLYIKCVNELLELLEEQSLYSEIVDICESVFIVEPYEEDFHLYYMEALVKEKKVKQARSHYEYITAALYRELGVKPSPEMREIYRVMHSNGDNVEYDLTSIQESLGEKKEDQKAFICDADVFRYIYKLERRRLERSGQSVFLALLTIGNSDYGVPPKPVLKDATEKLLHVLQETLRKGDTITQWNDAQILLMLPGLTLEQGDSVLARIQKNFKKYYNLGEIVIRSKIEPVIPL
ncbi:MAG: hypothetical protein APF84_09885 [Gracilibacter sp. BRH_c7a]|nr:MAG: hypothetical protein APF84_09885 [Gracilibacter sp. BRH_c7a]